MAFAGRIIVVFLFALTAWPLSAANRSTETWDATWPGGSCTIDLTFERDGFDGEADPRRKCGKLLRKARSFQYPTPARNTLVLFSRKKGRGKPLVILSRSDPATLQGVIKDQPVIFRLTAQSNLRGINLDVPRQGNAATCLTYANNQACVVTQDLENPAIPAFDAIEMQVLKRLKIYPFSGGKGIPEDDKLERGSCQIVKKCETAFNSTEDWCEVELEAGGITGWVLRRDDQQVFLRTGC